MKPHILSHVTPMYTHNVSPSHLKIYDAWVTMIPLTDCTKLPPNVHIFRLSLLKHSQRTPRDTFTHHLCPTDFHSGVTWEGHGSSLFLLDLDIRNIVYKIVMDQVFDDYSSLADLIRLSEPILSVKTVTFVSCFLRHTWLFLLLL